MKYYTLQEALRTAVKLEKDRADFYLAAADMATTPKVKELFNRIAEEEFRHMESFLRYYKGDTFVTFQDILAAPPDFDDSTYRELLHMVAKGTHEKTAMELSIQDEKKCLDLYTEYVEELSIDPLVKSVFEQAILETTEHYETLKIEYDKLAETEKGLVSKNFESNFS
ncbi:MAG: ferritin family protein [Desulfuromonadales bacterium]|nr:ferritin family protein [Desulfuromonadales bacterium]